MTTVLAVDSLHKKANALKGCLSHLKLETGRRRFADDNDDPLAIANLFASDEAKILMSKAWRNLENKTQVFTQSESTYTRNRLTHVTEVKGVAIIVSEMLGVNTDLVRAAAIGHDIGHVPFGHQGEDWMKKAMNRPDFCHEVMGPIVLQKIERQGKGLNLCHETLEAMMRHSGDMVREGMSQEAWVLRYADKFAYIFADINDLVKRVNYPLSSELTDLAGKFGSNHRERVTTAICGLVLESAEYGRVSFEYSELALDFAQLRKFMYEVYPRVAQQNVDALMRPALDFLAQLNVGNPFLLLALMNDKDIFKINKAGMKDFNTFKRTSAFELMLTVKKAGNIDLCDPGLDW